MDPTQSEVKTENSTPVLSVTDGLQPITVSHAKKAIVLLQLDRLNGRRQFVGLKHN